jgi:RNA polymerase sigma factor (sigma-70 family)
MSGDEELRLASRLEQCRRELLAISLLDPTSNAALQSAPAEVAARVLRPASTTVQAVPSTPPPCVADPLDAFRCAAAELARAASARWQALTHLGASDACGTPLPPELDAELQSSLRLVDALPFEWDGMERLLQGRAAQPPAAAQPAAPSSALPPALQHRARALEAEAARIVSRFISAHQALVGRVSQRYLGMGLSRDDLMQDGNIGLLRAIYKFDVHRGTPFGPYAVLWIREAMRRALAKQSRTIRIPVHALAARYTLGQASKRLAHELGREPSPQELAQATGVHPESVAQALSLVKEPLSLDAPRDRLSETTLGESIPDRAGPNANERIDERERVDQVQALLDGLPPREQQILKLRFGLDGSDERTLEEIGRSFDLTRERVRQIVVAALDKLHRETRRREHDAPRWRASETRRSS